MGPKLMIKANCVMSIGLLIGYFLWCSAQEEPSNIKTFEDPESGISFNYLQYWQVALEKYSEDLTEATKDSLAEYSVVNRSILVVDMLPISESGAFFTIVCEILLFPCLWNHIERQMK